MLPSKLEESHNKSSQVKNQVEEFKINHNNIEPVVIPNDGQTKTPKTDDDDDVNKNQTTSKVDEGGQIGCGNGTGIYRIIVVDDYDNDEDYQQRSISSFFNSIIVDEFAPELEFF